MQANLVVPRKNLSDSVYHRLLEMITTLQLPPGSRLNFTALAELFQVSGVPLREAVQRLVAKGLVISRPQMGYHVVKLAPQDIFDIYEIRSMMETLALKRSLPAIPTEELLALRHVFEEEHALQEKSGTAERSAAYRQADWRLHFTLIVGYAESPLISQMSANIFEFVEITRNLLKFLADSLPKHLAIIEGILARDYELASSALESHLKITAQRVIEALPPN